MRTGAYAPGAIETGILCMAQAQLGRFYNVPTGGYIGLTNAHANDAQSGYETGMNTLGAVLAGATLLNMGGLLSSLMAFDFAKAVIDDEIALMNKRVVRGAEFSEEHLALDVIAAVGPGGDFMKSKHTKSLMKTTAVLPKVADRGMRGQWEQAGRPSAHDRALDFARSILSKPNPAVWASDLDDRIRSEFPGLVAGDAIQLEAPLV
jgi:trimethylamine--corrinoid protein Co-methyltransferase